MNSSATRLQCKHDLAGWNWRRWQFAGKLALAGCLALYAANLLALHQPAWAITTVMMLSLPIYVGAVGEKALFRTIGTLCGGLLAVFLVGNFSADGFVFLTLLFGIICFCVFFNAGTRSPYAFFLTALTLLVITTGSYTEPMKAWELAVARVEEILLGVFCSLLATALLWPRYARDDFRKNASLGLGELLALQELILEENPRPIASQPEAAVTARVARLRQLIQMGGRESLYFRANLDVLRDFVVTLAALAQTLLEIAALREKNPGLRTLLEQDREVYWQTWRKLIEAAQAGQIPEAADLVLIKELGAQMRTHLDATNSASALREAPIPVAERMARSAVYILVLDTLDHTEHLLEVWNLLRTDSSPSQEHSVSPICPPTRPTPIGFFGLQNGVRCGLATVATFIFCDWLQPPGAGLIPLMAFIFTSTSRTFLDARGDTGMFTNLVVVALLGIPWFLFVLLISPFLTDYLWMNVFLAAMLLGFGGYVYPRLPQMSYRGFALLNGIVATIALNFQEPVTFEMVANNYFGLVLGIGFAAIFQRTFWPILPQREFRHNVCKVLQELSGSLRQALANARNGSIEERGAKGATKGATKDSVLGHLTEARKWEAQLERLLRERDSGSGDQECVRRRAALYLLQRVIRVVFRLQALEKTLPPWPEAHTVLGPTLIEVQETAAQILEDLGRWWQSGEDVRHTFPASIVEEKIWPLAEKLPSLWAQAHLSQEEHHAWMALLLREKTLIERVREFSSALQNLSRTRYLQDPIL